MRPISKVMGIVRQRALMKVYPQVGLEGMVDWAMVLHCLAVVGEHDQIQHALCSPLLQMFKINSSFLQLSMKAPNC